MPGPRLLVCVAVCSLLSVPVFARQSTPTSSSTSDPQAVALVQKSLAVLTGGAVIADVTLTGSARQVAGSDDETGTATLEATSVGDSRVELDFASGNRIEIRNHSALPLPEALPEGLPSSVAQIPQPVGEWIGSDGKSHAMSGHNIMTDSAWFFPALALARIATLPNYELSYIGQETHNGATVLHISASRHFSPEAPGSSERPVPLGAAPARLQAFLQHLSQMDFYLDPNSFLPVALDFMQHPDNNALVDIPTEIRFSDYQTIDGVAIPLHVQKYLNYGLVLDLQFSKAEVNAGVSTGNFAVQ